MISFNQLGNHGHLGNQMFQFAALKGIAMKHNRTFIIPPTKVFGKYYYTPLRSNIDDCFIINCERGISDFYTINEKTFSFDKDLFDNFPKENVNLLGFFQSDKWFKHIKDEIKKDFMFIPNYYDNCSKSREEFSKDLISLHIRRTDYINNPCHFSPSMSYYEKALEILPKDCEVLIFSDDPGWCNNQELFSGDRFFISETNNPYIDLCLMTMCQYHIIAASSYSWWGAYLAESQKVIAPSVWFGPNNSHLETIDIYLENWVKL